MSDNNTLSWIRFFMKNINLMLIMMISTVMAYTTYKTIEIKGAGSFLDSMDTLPIQPWMRPVISLLAFLLLLGMMQWRGKEQWSNLYFSVYGLLQVFLCLVIMQCLGYSYSGIVLVVIVDLIVCWSNTKLKMLFVGMMFVIYVFMNIGLFSENEITVFHTYLMYYNTETRSLLSGLKRVLASGNNLLFILYIVMLIRIQIMENRRILLLNQQLDEANEKLQRANFHLEEYGKTKEKMAQTRERNRLAREIHDTLGHSLTGIIAGIDACITLIDIAPEEVKKQLNIIGNVARQGIKDVRRSVNALRPDALERLGLEDALKQIITDTKMVTNVEIFYDNEADLKNLDEDEIETIYRIVQESITNALRHGKADIIYVKIKKTLNVITILIKDNGVGCKNMKKGFGLRHMAERLELLNGSLEYRSENGFTIIAKIPIRWGK